jgi:uncharacterized membrane protein
VLTGSQGPGKAVGELIDPGPGKRLMFKLALKAGKHFVRRALPDKVDLDALRLDGARHALTRGFDGAQGLSQRVLESAATSTQPTSRRRPPIQSAVEVSVPLRVAWAEWQKLAWLPEGVDDVLHVKRGRKGRLRGRLARGEGTWKGEILDEREQESFAWQSHAGSDCAGLITFRELDETLTRIEVSLDVVPTSVAQAAAMTTRLADRRADADLRRLKAHLELINPDSYEGDGDAPDA